MKKWAIVTGASAGIGEATAIRLAAAGVNLLIIGRRADRLQNLQQMLGQSVKVVPEPVDVCDFKALRSLADRQKEIFANAEILINSAGLARGTESIQDGVLEDWEAMIDTNVKGLLYLTKLVLPGMIRQRRGHVVNLGSSAGRWVYPGGAVYCATKFAVRALSEGMRMDLNGTSVRVTNIEPGMCDTEFSVVRLGDKDKAKKVYSNMRPLTADDVAETIMWTLQRPAHVNIQELVIFPTDQAAVGLVHRS